MICCHREVASQSGLPTAGGSCLGGGAGGDAGGGGGGGGAGGSRKRVGRGGGEGTEKGQVEWNVGINISPRWK